MREMCIHIISNSTISPDHWLSEVVWQRVHLSSLPRSFTTFLDEILEIGKSFMERFSACPASYERVRDFVVEPLHRRLILLQAKFLAGYKVDYSAIVVQLGPSVDVEIDGGELEDHGIRENCGCALDVEHDVRVIAFVRHSEPISMASKSN